MELPEPFSLNEPTVGSSREGSAPDKPISGVWRRLAAFAIDGVVLGIVGHVFGLFFMDLFVSLGGWGRLLGFVVAGVYFSVFDSAIGGGQTLGKKLMGIRVVDEGGNLLSLGRSLARYTVLGVPFFLNGAVFPTGIMPSFFGFLVGLIVFGLGGAILYLSIFNRATRQSVHDLAVRSLVVKRCHRGDLRTKAMWKGHRYVVGAWLATTVVVMSVVLPGLFGMKPMPALHEIQNRINKTGRYTATRVVVGESVVNHQRFRYLGVNVILNARNYDEAKAAAEVAEIVYEQSPTLLEREVMTVTVCYGYDIGIASLWKTYRQRFPPRKTVHRADAPI